jgi:hypothetical protein
VVSQSFYPSGTGSICTCSYNFYHTVSYPYSRRFLKLRIVLSPNLLILTLAIGCQRAWLRSALGAEGVARLIATILGWLFSFGLSRSTQTCPSNASTSRCVSSVGWREMAMISEPPKKVICPYPRVVQLIVGLSNSLNPTFDRSCNTVRDSN